MYLLGIGIVLLLMKWQEIGPVAAWSWWIVLAPFAAAALWWTWADWSGYTKRKAMEALERVGLADRANDHVQVFSGGQSQRVLIARALVRHPDLLILDEPLAGIDRDSREALAETLQALHGGGVTIVTVLHEMGELGPLIERTIALEDGHVAFDGPPTGIGAQAEIHHHTDETPTPHHAPVLRTETS